MLPSIWSVRARSNKAIVIRAFDGKLMQHSRERDRHKGQGLGDEYNAPPQA